MNFSQLSYKRFTSILYTACFVFTGCAYFNTFYNAEVFFEKAEKLRLEKAGESIPPTAIDAYGKVVDKSRKVIEKYPDSKYRQSALFLMGKSHYHRTEYRIAENVFLQYANEYSDDAQRAEYWLSLCKWKLGKSQPALEQLQNILTSADEKELISKVHYSIAEIYLEDDNSKQALEHLDLAASTNRDRDQRGQIYFRMAALAFDSKEYERALIANSEVIKNTTSKKRKEEASLKIVQIHRMLGNWDKVTSLIKTMLLDEVFKTIHGDLEIELVKLYQMDSKLDEAITRLESIKEDYSNTKISAEASYIHGEIALYNFWELEDAKKYFGQVAREYRQSPFTSSANIRVKEINDYQESADTLLALSESIMTMEADLDTIKNDSIKAILEDELNTSKANIAGHLYNIGELEAFHFKRQDSSKVHFQEIIEEHSESDFYPKALFVLYYLNDLSGNIEISQLYSDRILNELPTSEFADYLRSTLDLPMDPNSSKAVLIKGELQWLIDPVGALEYYKKIIHNDSRSETAAKAAYFLAYHYDYTFYEPDSAQKYYTWLMDNHSNSEQAAASRTRYNILQQTIASMESDTLDH